MAVHVIIVHVLSPLKKVSASIDSHTLAHPSAYVGYHFLWERRQGPEDWADTVELLKKDFFIPEANSIHGPSLGSQGNLVEISQVVKLFLLAALEGLHVILNCVKATKHQVKD